MYFLKRNYLHEVSVSSTFNCEVDDFSLITNRKINLGLVVDNELNPFGFNFTVTSASVKYIILGFIEGVDTLKIYYDDVEQYSYDFVSNPNTIVYFNELTSEDDISGVDVKVEFSGLDEGAYCGEAFFGSNDIYSFVSISRDLIKKRVLNSPNLTEEELYFIYTCNFKIQNIHVDNI